MVTGGSQDTMDKVNKYNTDHYEVKNVAELSPTSRKVVNAQILASFYTKGW